MEKKVKIVFGLESQGHIPTIEAELKRWNDSFNADYPDHKIKDAILDCYFDAYDNNFKIVFQNEYVKNITHYQPILKPEPPKF